MTQSTTDKGQHISLFHGLLFALLLSLFFVPILVVCKFVNMVDKPVRELAFTIISGAMGGYGYYTLFRFVIQMTKRMKHSHHQVSIGLQLVKRC